MKIINRNNQLLTETIQTQTSTTDSTQSASTGIIENGQVTFSENEPKDIEHFQFYLKAAQI